MSTKKLKEYMKNPPLEKIGGATLINFSKIIEEEMKDPKFRKGVELEMKKLEMSLAIINLRKKKKISQAKLAEKIGMKQSAVGRIEAGKQNLTIETLQKIAFALNKELVVSFR
ncbi:MAG: helix-turn-helix transcriptional regulator [Patescibacteria group bacterium]|nr:helix-turn-helix transcriptional regulator [Patescibacteria group bacterium]